MTFLTVVVYCSLVALTLKTIGLCQERRALGLAFGTLLGALFFLAMPLGIAFGVGAIDDPGIMADPYLPFQDIEVTYNLFLGWFVCLLACWVDIFYFGQNDEQQVLVEDPESKVKLIVLAYMSIFIMSGYVRGIFTQGGHWHDSGTDIFKESAGFTVLLNFANSYRLLAFAGLLYLIENRKLSLKHGMVFGGALVAFDMMVSFNRISAAYFLVFLLLVLRQHWVRVLLALVVLAPVAAKVSTIWSWFRGVATEGGFDVGQFASKWSEVSSNYAAQGNRGFAEEMNGVFESSNIQVFSHLVKNVGDNIEVLWGYTYILRPLTAFIPSAVWPDKPNVFGSYLGVWINSYQGLSLNSTLFGEVYTNFFYFWPLVLLMTLIMLSVVYRHIRSVLPFSLELGTFVGFALWRFEVNFALVSLYGLVLIAVLSRFTGSKKLVWEG